jgi:hypothetical protein
MLFLREIFMTNPILVIFPFSFLFLRLHLDGS